MQTTEQDVRPTALVVDYNAWERSFTTEVLTERGIWSFGVSNGASWPATGRKHECDVILLELAIPEVSLAPSSWCQLKSADVTREIPVIVLGADPCGATAPRRDAFQASRGNAYAERSRPACLGGRMTASKLDRAGLSLLARCQSPLRADRQIELLGDDPFADVAREHESIKCNAGPPA